MDQTQASEQMGKFMKKAGCILLFCIFVGCATEPFRPASAYRYQEMLDTWKNQDINELIYAWGPPTSCQWYKHRNCNVQILETF